MPARVDREFSIYDRPQCGIGLPEFVTGITPLISNRRSAGRWPGQCNRCPHTDGRVHLNPLGQLGRGVTNELSIRGPVTNQSRILPNSLRCPGSTCVRLRQ